MLEIQKMKAGKYYLIESKASANSVYFEKDALAKLFFRYCDYYLKDFLHIEEYILNKDGWAMLIKVRSVQTIRKYYELKELSRKSKPKDEESDNAKEIWWILSERVRLFISTYVRMSNKILGREGSLVRRKYGRYQFDNLKEAKDYVSSIRNDQHKMQQSKEKYRGLKLQFQMHGTIYTNPLKSSMWVELCGAREQLQDKLEKIFEGNLAILKDVGDLVAQKFDLRKIALKPPSPNPPKP